MTNHVEDGTVTAVARAVPAAKSPARSVHKPAARIGPVGYNILSLAIGIGLWQLLAIALGSPFFPAPLKIVTAFLHLAANGDTLGNSLWAHSWASLSRVLVGFGLAVLFGVPLGLLMGLYRPLYASTRAIIEPFRFIPPIAWIPLAIIFFSGLTRFAFLIFLGAFFPIYTATHVGVSRVEPIHRKVFMIHNDGPLLLSAVMVGLPCAGFLMSAVQVACATLKCCDKAGHWLPGRVRGGELLGKRVFEHPL